LKLKRGREENLFIRALDFPGVKGWMGEVFVTSFITFSQLLHPRVEGGILTTVNRSQAVIFTSCSIASRMT